MVMSMTQQVSNDNPKGNSNIVILLFKTFLGCAEMSVYSNRDSFLTGAGAFLTKHLRAKASCSKHLPQKSKHPPGK